MLPLATLKSYNSVSLDQKRALIYAYLTRKNLAVPNCNPKSYISVNLDQKGAEIMHI